MNELNNPTPISLIVSDELEWKISYEIHPIQLHHATRIAEMISKDVLFEYLDINVVGYMERVTRIVLKADGYWLDLALMSDEYKLRLDHIIDEYLAVNGGYAEVQV